ncbi:MAG: hypothetical protein ACFFCV_16960 [Promethearchaeota archaeon]
MRKIRIKLIITYFTINIAFLSNGFLYVHDFQFYEKSNSEYSNSFNISSNSSSWSQILGIDTFAEKIVTDSSNNVYIAGGFCTNREGPIFNVKFDEYGQKLWNSTWKLNNDTKFIADLAVDSKQKIYNLINFYFLEDTSILMKINNSGNSIWNQTLEGTARSIYLDDYDNIYILGNVWDSRRDGQHIYLKKFNTDGISQWNHSFLLDDYYLLYGFPCTIMVDHLNQTYIAGIISTGSWSFSFDNYWGAPIIFTCVYSSSGSLVSFNSWHREDYYISSTMIFDILGNLYLMGTDKEITQNIILKYDSSWHLNKTIDVWQNDAIRGTSDVWASISIDNSKNIYCAGINSFFSGNELYLVKFNSSGHLEFDGAWNNLSSTWCFDIHVDSDLNIYVTGLTGIGLYNKRALIIKNPVLGEFSDPPTPIDIPYIISISSIVFVCGVAGIYFIIQFRRRFL